MEYSVEQQQMSIFNEYDWDVYFISLRKYLEYFRSCTRVPSMRGLPQMISEQELAGLLGWTELAVTAAKNNGEVRRRINDERSWNCVENIVGLLTCGIPLILKGKLYEFLAAMAIDEEIGIHIWNCLISEGVCFESGEGKMCGIQQDLEEQETVAKAYDCSEGFLKLMKELFSHKTRPGATQLAPYLNFIVKSILCQFVSRSYVDLQQMWDLVSLALDSLCQLLQQFHVTRTSVSKQTSEVWLLTQLLNNTPLLVNVLNIIVECRDGPTIQKPDAKRILSRDQASLAAIRLIYMAVNHRNAFADYIRAVGSNLMICTIEALMFSPLPHFGKNSLAVDNCLSLLLSYINENDYFVKHTFYVVRILRNLCCQRPSLQKQILQAHTISGLNLVDKMALLTHVFDESRKVEVPLSSLPFSDIEGQSLERIRGEIIRDLLEAFIESISSDPNWARNLAFSLLGFDLSNINDTDINYADSQELTSTCLYNFMEVASALTIAENSTAVNYAGLYEPCLRLLLRLALPTSLSSIITLRIMRSHYDLIHKLIEAFPSVIVHFDDVNYMYKIQLVVLELAALELSALLRLGDSAHCVKIFTSLWALECSQEVLPGWLSVIEVLAINSPLSFLDDDANKKVLVGSLCMLKSYCMDDDTDIIRISDCMFRVVRALCEFYVPTESYQPKYSRRVLLPVVHLLLQCIVSPRYNKCVQYKLNVYASILCIFDTIMHCKPTLKDEKEDQKPEDISSRADSVVTAAFDTSTVGTTQLAELMNVEREETECWSKFFEPMAAEIVDTLSSDITYAPLNLKIAATACLSDIIREDLVHSKSVAYHFVHSGAMACVVDSFTREAADLCAHEKNVKVNIKKSRRSMLLKTSYSLFSRLAASEYGWTAMMNGRVFERLISSEGKENMKLEEGEAEEDTIRLFRKLLETMSKF